MGNMLTKPSLPVRRNILVISKVANKRLKRYLFMAPIISSTTDFLNYQQPYRTQSLDALANLNLNQQNSTFRTSRRHCKSWFSNKWDHRIFLNC